MILLHTGDFHLGVNRRFPNYLRRQRDFIEELLEVCASSQANFLVVAGDLFEYNNPTTEEKNLISLLFGECQIPIVGIPGNHDWIGPKWEDTTLKWAFYLKNKLRGVRLFVRPSVSLWKGVWWVAMPSTKWNSISYQIVLDFLIDSIPEKSPFPIVVVAHEYFYGSVLENGFAPENLVRLPNRSRVAYYALGDVHKQQMLRKNAFYCGSAFQNDFGERRPKGLLKIKLNEKLVVEFIELKKAAYLIKQDGVPKTWPKNAYVELSCASYDIPSPLPEFVVALKPTDAIKDLKIQKEGLVEIGGSLPSRIKSWLKKSGEKPKNVKLAYKLAEKAIKEIAD